MRKTTEEIGAYGVVNGLGISGDPQQKAKLLRRVGRALDRGDLGLLLEYLAAYGAGAWAGTAMRKAIVGPPSSSEGARWD